MFPLCVVVLSLFLLIKPCRTEYVLFLLNPAWICSPAAQQANLLTPGHGKGKFSVYCRAPSKQKQAAHAQKT